MTTEHKKLIEQMARAMCLANNHDPDAYIYDAAPAELQRPDWTFYQDEAIAALNAVYEALKEPSDEMLQAGHETLYEEAYDATRDFALAPTWQAMLSASALSSSPLGKGE